MENENIFEALSKIDVSEHVEEKMGLKYLSWTWAWFTIKRFDPKATKEFTKFPEYNWNATQLTGRNVDYCKTDTGTYVEATVTIKGQSESETLPVMDHKNKSVLNPDQMQINKAKQRCFVKACALHGLGLNLYAGEDAPLDNSIDKNVISQITETCDKISDYANDSSENLINKAVKNVGKSSIKDLDKKQGETMLNQMNNYYKRVKSNYEANQRQIEEAKEAEKREKVNE